MKLDGAALYYLIAQEFGDAEYRAHARTATFDFPILYDKGTDMSGHVVLVPAHERPSEQVPGMYNTLCVCLGENATNAARAGGRDAILIQGDVTFQRLYNFMQSLFVRNERLDAQLRAYVDAATGFEALVSTFVQVSHYSCALVDAQYRGVCSAIWQGGEPEQATPTAER